MLFVFAGIASFIHGGIEQHLPGYVESVGFTSSFAAAVVSAQSVGSVVDKLVMGWLNDKLGVQRTTIIELVLIVLGILGFVPHRVRCFVRRAGFAYVGEPSSAHSRGIRF